MQNFVKRNRILKKNDSYLIYLNIPEDCIYDVTNIIVNYNNTSNIIKIISDDIPDNIKNRMIKYFNGDIKDYISFLEVNLDLFLSGKEPKTEKDNTILEIDEENRLDNNTNDNIFDFKELDNTTHTNDLSNNKFDNIDKIIFLPDKFVYPTQTVNINTLQIDYLKKGIYFFTAKKINIQVNCKKCKTSTELEDLKTCKCGSTLKSTFISTLDNEILGSLFLDNCTFLHLNPTNFQFNCEKCFANFQSNKIGINEKFRMDCWRCNNLLSFCIKKVVYLEKKSYNFKVGSELPNKGTCKHYKKSFRWFRFSCCKSVYPCDICHDDENNHQCQPANKMICGLCSKEQSVKSNCNCGMDIKKSTTFWEGGKGSRNKATMSRKDSKKYTK